MSGLEFLRKVFTFENFNHSAMKRILFILAGMLLLLSACQLLPLITITSPSEIELSADGGSGVVIFTANREWRASSPANWIHVSPASGDASKDAISVTVTADANTTYDDRTATVTVSIDGMSQTVTVTQQANLGIILPTKTYEVKAEAQTIEVEVQANVEYEVSIGTDWIQQAGTKGLTSEKYTFNIVENPSYSPREGTIFIKSKSAKVPDQVVSVKQAGFVPQKVDLGVVVTRGDGSTYKLYWADCNIGAVKPEEYGFYYAWGEIEPKETYTFENYKWGNGSSLLTKYCPTNKARDYWGGSGDPDNKTRLDPEDDAARVILGDGWRMPTLEEYTALLAQCTWKYISGNGSYGQGIYGYEGKSKTNGNTIFFPTAGWWQQSLQNDGTGGWYWSSDLYLSNPKEAYYLYWLPGTSIRTGQNVRYRGRSVRPVIEE